jgi:hypothetical protein
LRLRIYIYINIIMIFFLHNMIFFLNTEYVYIIYNIIGIKPDLISIIFEKVTDKVGLFKSLFKKKTTSLLQKL